MNVFDIIGPVMVGPSSSHTAGAARIGRLAREILGEDPASADIVLYGSFADTGRGHGTDKAIAAGLMGYGPESLQIRDALELARQKGILFRFEFSAEDMGHPNVAEIRVTGTGGRKADIIGRSLGGGRVLITSVDGFPVELSGEEYTLFTRHRDVPGVVARVCEILAEEHINISTMRVFRKGKGEDAVMIIHTDEKVPVSVAEELMKHENIAMAMTFDIV